MFGFHGHNGIRVQIKLDLLAYNLLIEEYGDAVNDLRKISLRSFASFHSAQDDGVWSSGQGGGVADFAGLLAGFMPAWEVFVHKGVETGIMAWFKKMTQLMYHHMLHAPYR